MQIVVRAAQGGEHFLLDEDGTHSVGETLDYAKDVLVGLEGSDTAERRDATADLIANLQELPVFADAELVQ